MHEIEQKAGHYRYIDRYKREGYGGENAGVIHGDSRGQKGIGRFSLDLYSLQNIGLPIY